MCVHCFHIKGFRVLIVLEYLYGLERILLPTGGTLLRMRVYVMQSNPHDSLVGIAALNQKMGRAVHERTYLIPLLRYF